MATKTYRIEFLQGYVQSDDNTRRVSHVLKEVVESGCRAVRLGAYDYRVNPVEMTTGGRSFKGVFAKYRADVLPHVGAPEGEEREIDLADDEGIIEKNHFLYFARKQLLVYQTNHYGSRPSTFGRYLTSIANETISFDPILQPEALRRLLSGHGRPRSIDISYAKPSEATLKEAGDELTRELIKILTTTGGARARVKISPPRKKYLHSDIRKVMGRLMDDLEVRKARVTVEEDGVEHPIDLIADRLFGEGTVKMDGRYPVSEEMYDALRKCYDERRLDLDGILHDPGDGQN